MRRSCYSLGNSPVRREEEREREPKKERTTETIQQKKDRWKQEVIGVKCIGERNATYRRHDHNKKISTAWTNWRTQTKNKKEISNADTITIRKKKKIPQTNWPKHWTRDLTFRHFSGVLFTVAFMEITKHRSCLIRRAEEVQASFYRSWFGHQTLCQTPVQTNMTGDMVW